MCCLYKQIAGQMWLSIICMYLYAFVSICTFMQDGHVPWHIHMRTCVPWLVLCVCHDSCICASVCHESIMCVPSVIHMRTWVPWLVSCVCVCVCVCVCAMTHAHVHLCAVTQLCVCHDSFACALACHDSLHVCAMTPSYVHLRAVTPLCVCHDSFMCAPVCHDSFMWVLRFAHMCVMTQMFVCIRVHKELLCAVTPICVCRDSCICVSWLRYVSVYTCCDSSMRVPWLIHKWTSVKWLLYVFAVTRAYMCHDTGKCLYTDMHNRLPMWATAQVVCACVRERQRDR